MGWKRLIWQLHSSIIWKHAAFDSADSHSAIHTIWQTQINTRLCTHAQTRADKHDALHLYTTLCK